MNEPTAQTARQSQSSVCPQGDSNPWSVPGASNALSENPSSREYMGMETTLRRLDVSKQGLRQDAARERPEVHRKPRRDSCIDAPHIHCRRCDCSIAVRRSDLEDGISGYCLTCFPEREQDPSRDGCDCPPWVIRCAHFEGNTLVLVGPHGTRHDLHSQCTYAVYDAAFWRVCNWCGDRAAPAFSPVAYAGSDLIAAHAAFDAAELRLLAGDLGVKSNG